MKMRWLVAVVLSTVVGAGGNLVWESPSDALDGALYEQALDAELCERQVSLLARDASLLFRFLDAGIRTPRGVLIGNTLDLGNYHQCLDITEHLEESVLQGKYCMIRVPLSQSLARPETREWPAWSQFNPHSLAMRNETARRAERWHHLRRALRAAATPDDRLLPDSPLSSLTFRVAVCIPRPCSTEQAISSLLFNVTALGFQYQDEFCRLPGDKPWAPADTALVVVFSVLGVVTLLSTGYDLYHTFILKKDLKTGHKYGKLFSVYTNGRRLMKFSAGAGALHCVDGVRALAMMWVVVGHSFTSESHWLNPIDTFTWTSSFGALWITGAHITVDTFFTLSGILVVYTTAGKLTPMKLLKNIHLFYLNRLLRMFPLLAAGVLLEASYLNRATDGPDWRTIVSQVDRCRTFWWSTLLHIQNYLNPGMTCIGQSWYLAIDTQLHVVSPAVLVFVLGGGRRAWAGLAAALLLILLASTVYNFLMEFPSTMMNPNRGHEMMYYLHKYYVNTLTRGAPFFVGMFFGYLLHLWRDEKINIGKVHAACVWVAAFTLSTFVMYSSYPILQPEWDNRALDSLYNSFIRPTWAAALGTMIFLCVQGYGGPVEWFLSLGVWKLPARISYAMYVTHWALMTAVNSTAVAPLYFSPALVTFKALAHYSFAFAVSFLLTLTVDAPFSSIFKLALGAGTSKRSNVEQPSTSTSTKDDKQIQ